MDKHLQSLTSSTQSESKLLFSELSVQVSSEIYTSKLLMLCPNLKNINRRHLIPKYSTHTAFWFIITQWNFVQLQVSTSNSVKDTVWIRYFAETV